MRLPLYTLDLARRYWAPLLCVYLVGSFIHDMLMRSLVFVADFDQNIALIGVALATLVELTMFIVMFHMLRPALPTVDTELVSSRTGTLGERERRWVDAVAMAILPFLIFYNAWGVFEDEFRQYTTTLFNERGFGMWTDAAFLNALGLPLAIALSAYLLRVVCDRYYTRTDNKALGLLSVVFEANWMFFACFSTAHIFGSIQEWAADRRVWVESTGALLEAVRSLGEATSLPLEAGYLAMLQGLGAAATVFWEGVTQPLVWLTIAAVIFGAEIDRHEALFRKGTRAAKVEELLTGDRRGFVHQISRFARQDTAERYMPFLNAFRFILRASPVFFLGFCLNYVLIELGCDWLQRGVFVLIGPHDFLGWWWPLLEPVHLAVEAVRHVLRVCLLAVTFEITLRSVTAASTGRRARVPGRVG
ncbi:hypothetical protein ACFPZ0_23320 [Streptomonospora nanhaiensis]|uniref:Uncharacterized protein n=1 Tax=Streptomonospora nanhaiensis TaxID=1323731 RepID=A0A853BPU5_9ACTN|nr:hypothetical protein [Streptomonospora nanhaiensis]MBV2364318.1 hypothetical protein [Streptomonospora nanhaiensis]MBX9391596.1 hypothetical protein [Streptomonospora nanhaiensis]NYI97203.1 hypothetical protein [Streptomonospora nanhaiensis]